ncbi:hypothetical protein A9W96_29635 [Mycobacterium sp. 1245852.3]|nr:hypothetical protein A9W96_29635 [Mycobacterium sp. 1245852.3]
MLISADAALPQCAQRSGCLGGGQIIMPRVSPQAPHSTGRPSAARREVVVARPQLQGLLARISERHRRSGSGRSAMPAHVTAGCGMRCPLGPTV